MKLSTVLACLGLICAAPPALTQATAVQVPAGDLADAVESLGKQTGVNVLYPGDLLKGRTTAGVAGTLSPAEAFTTLLEGTSLTVTQENGAMRIAQVSSPVLVAAPPEAARTSAKVPEKSTCRNVSSLAGVVQSMCGTPEQWTEFDSRMAKLDKGFSCKPMKGSIPLCLFAKQWQNLQRDKTLRYGTVDTRGDEAQRSAMDINRNDSANVSLSVRDSLATNGGTPLP